MAYRFTKQKLQNVFKQSIALLASYAIAVHPAIAQSVATTPISGDLEIYDSANGVPIVDIVEPNAQGVSHNIYGAFNVGEEGLIFNNADQNFVDTQLAGQIYGNDNLQSGPASVILNEVLYNNPSELLGYMEVAGHQADVIIANPYGITCNGCGFINTDKATLTTGTPFYEGGEFRGFNVTRGAVAIGELGADGTGASQFDILSRSIEIGGTIYGQSVRLIAGQNNIIYATGVVTERDSDGSVMPEFAIDSTVLGGMYAGSITIISNEDGVGVKAPTNMAANAGEMYITADGQLVIGSGVASGDVIIEANQDIIIQNQIYSQAQINLEAARDLIVENNAQIVAQSALEITADHAIALAQGAQILSVLDMNILSASLSAAGDNVIAAGFEEAVGNVQTASLDVDISGSAQLAASTVYASGDFEFDAANIIIGSDVIDPSQFISDGNMALTASTIEAEGAAINSANDLTIASNIVNTADATIQAQNDMNITGLNRGNLNIIGGDYLAGNGLSVEAAYITNSADMMALNGALSFTSTSGDIRNSGVLQANNTVEIHAVGDLTHIGTIEALGNITLDISQIFINSGDVQAGNLIQLASFDFDNQSAGTINANLLDLDITNNMTNSGVVDANGILILDVVGTLTNSGTIEAGSNDISIDPNAPLNASINLGGLTNTGIIQSTNSVINIVAIDSFNNNGGTVYGSMGAVLELGVGLDSQNMGTISSGDWISLTGLNNGYLEYFNTSANTEFGAIGDLIIKAENFNNAGAIYSATGNLYLTAQNNITNTGVIYAGGDWMQLLLGGTLNNNGGAILAINNMVIAGTDWDGANNDRATGIVNQHEGRIETINGDMWLVASSIRNIADTPVIGSRYFVDNYDTVLNSYTVTQWLQPESGCGFGCRGGDGQVRSALLQYIVHYRTELISSEDPSSIVSGGNIVFDSEILENAYSEIVAQGNIAINSTNVLNTSARYGDQYFTVNTNYYHNWGRNWSGQYYWQDGPDYTILNANGETREIFGNITSASWDYSLMQSVYGTIAAGGNITGNISDLDINQNVAVSSNTGSVPDFSSSTSPDSLNLYEISISGTETLDNIDPEFNAFLQTPLFVNSQNNSSGYLIETRYDFIDQSEFASSDYFLEAFGVTPSSDPPLRLGDAFVETNYIRDQIFDQTGVTILNPGMSESEQIEAMYNNAIDASQNLELSLGVALTPDQQAALTQDIIWMETQIINGQEVLVPVVYLANGGGQYASLSRSGLSAGGNINLNVDNLTNNGGALVAGDQLMIDATNDIINNGGRLEGGYNLSSNPEYAALQEEHEALQELLAAISSDDLSEEDYAYLSAVFPELAETIEAYITELTEPQAAQQDDKATEDIAEAIDQERISDIVTNNQSNELASVFVESNDEAVENNAEYVLGKPSSSDTSQSDVDITDSENKQALIAALTTKMSEVAEEISVMNAGVSTSVVLTADGNVENYSGTITGVDVAISAENIINETTTSHFGDDSNYTDIAAVTGSIGGTGDTALIAVNDITFTGADLTAGGDATLQAGGDVTFAALALESAYENSGSDHGAWGSETEWSNSSYTLQAQTSTLSAGGNLTITSTGGNIISVGAELVAGTDSDSGTLALNAENNIILAAAYEVHESSSSLSSNSFFGLTGDAGSHSEYALTSMGTSLTGDNITLNAGNAETGAEGNITLIGADINATNDIALSANGDISVLAAMDQSITSDASSSQGFFQGGGNGFLSLYGGEGESGFTYQSLVNGSSINAGGNITFDATGSMLAEAADVQSGGDLTIDVDEELMITGVANTITTGSDSDSWGIGASFSSSGSGASLFAGYQGTEQSFDQQQVVYTGSNFVAGGDLTANAGSDVIIAGSTVAAGAVEETEEFAGGEFTYLTSSSTGGNLSITSENGSLNVIPLENFTTTEESFSQTQIGVTVSVSSSTLAGIDQMQNGSDVYGQGQGNLAGLNDASAIMMGVSGVLDVSNAINNYADGLKNNASDNQNTANALGINASIGVGMTTTGSSSSSTSTNLVTSSMQSFGGNVTINSADDINLTATDIYADEDIALIAEDEVNILSGQEAYANSSSSDSFGAGVSFNMMHNFAPSVYANGSSNQNDGYGTNQVNSHVIAGGELTIQSGGDTNIIGGVATGETLDVDVGGDLTVASVQDTASSSGSGSNFSFNTGGSASIGGSGSGSDYAWVTEQSGLTATGEADINVAGHTQLDGGVIGSETEDALTFETGTFASTDIFDNDEAWDNSLTVSTNGTLMGTTGSGALYNHDREQTNFATVAGGDITITDEQAQAELVENGENGVNYDETAVNTDLDTAQIITKDEVNSATVYLDSEAIEEIVLGAPTIREAIDNFSDIIAADPLVSPEAVQLLNDLVDQLGIDSEEELKALEEALANATCTESSASLWNFNWLLASPAYAGLITSCSIYFGDALISFGTGTMTPEAREECKQSLAALNQLLETGHYYRILLNKDFSEIVEKYIDGDGNFDFTKFAKIEGLELLDADKSIFHQQGIDSELNMKFQNDSGDEIVISPNGTIVLNDVNMGTYNFGQGNEDHFILDVIPYVIYGNSENDPTTFRERFLQTVGTAFGQEWGGYPDYDPNWTRAEREAYEAQIEQELINRIRQENLEHMYEISGGMCAVCD